MPNQVPIIKLSSGYEMPLLGLGTWQSKPHEVEHAVEVALKSGYKLIDCAAVYNNEEEVGRGLKNSGVDRDQIFITSKLWNNAHRATEVRKACLKTLEDLGTSYLDLYLIHWPISFVPGQGQFPRDEETGFYKLDQEVTLAETWKALEGLVHEGLVRSIGVSNCNQSRIEEVLKTAEIPPAVNQFEYHPLFQQPELVDFCKKHNIAVTAYSPLGNNTFGKPRAIDDPRVIELASSIDRDPAQVVINFIIQQGIAVVPKSVTPSRIRSNLSFFTLPESAFNFLKSLDKHERYNRMYKWGEDVFDEASPQELLEAQVDDAKKYFSTS